MNIYIAAVRGAMPSSTDLAALRARIAHLDRGAGAPRAGLPLGIEAVDRHLPDGGLRRGALHEIVSGGADLPHGAAAALFAASLLGREKRPVLWVLRARDLFAPGLAAAGLHPDLLIYAETGDDAAVLPVAEEGLRHRGLVGVVAETARLSLAASRRLQLAAEGSGVTGLVIRRWAGRAAPDMTGTVAATRWRLTAAASPARDPRTLWRAELLRCRGGVPAEWILEVCDATGRLRLAAGLADRPAAAAPRRAAG